MTHEDPPDSDLDLLIYSVVIVVLACVLVLVAWVAGSAPVE